MEIIFRTRSVNFLFLVLKPPIVDSASNCFIMFSHYVPDVASQWLTVYSEIHIMIYMTQNMHPHQFLNQHGFLICLVLFLFFFHLSNQIKDLKSFELYSRDDKGKQ